MVDLSFFWRVNTSSPTIHGLPPVASPAWHQVYCFPQENGNLHGCLSFLERWKDHHQCFSKHNHSYLPPSNCHFPVVFKGFVQGIGTRLHLVCSKDDDLNRRLEECGRHLIVSDGSTKPLKRDLQKGQRKSKTPKPSQEKKGKENCMGEHLWPHSAVQSSYKKKKNLHLLHANTVNKEIFPQRTVISAKQNLTKMYKPTVPQRYVQHGPKNGPVFFLAKKDATRVAIQKKPLFLYLRGTVDIGP